MNEWMDGFNPLSIPLSIAEQIQALEIYRSQQTIVYTKPLDSFMHSDEERDLFAHLALAQAGYRFEVLPENSPQGYSNIDLLINDNKWEIKSPNGRTLRGVETAVRKALRQFKDQYGTHFEPRMILNTAYHSLRDVLLITEYRIRLEQHGFREALFIDKEGNVLTIDARKPDVPISRTAGFQ